MRKKLALFLLLGLCQITISDSVLAKKPKVYTPLSTYKYQQKILRQEEVEKYQRSLLPQSGYMTREEYEQQSKDIPSEERVVPERPLPKDVNMKYVPQPTYELTRYNNPPGSAELHIGRSLNYDRQFVCPGITSPNKDILVYPVVYYYAANDCTSGDLFVIPLDTSLPDVSRIQRANIIKQLPDPILSTDKDLNEKSTFRTMTPIDFTPDGTKLIAKEKIGNVNDGIWQTNLWVYDFNQKTARKIPEIREAIKFYWNNVEHLTLDEKRWDISPLGFDANDPERIMVSAFGYTGKNLIFLGVWSIDCNGQRALLVSLFNEAANISMNGYKLRQTGVINPTVVYNNEKTQNKLAKKERKAAKKTKRLDKKKKKKALKQKLKQMKKEEKTTIKDYKKQFRKSGPTETVETKTKSNFTEQQFEYNLDENPK